LIHIGNKKGTWVNIQSGKLKGWVFDAFLEKASRPVIPYRLRKYKRRFARVPLSKNGVLNSDLEKKFPFSKYPNYFKRCHEVEKLLMPRFRRLVRRRKGRLSLRLRSGRWVSLINSKRATVYSIHYYFRGVLGKTGYYVVIKGYYEGYNILLINMRNGKRYLLDNVPALSPNGRYLALTSSGAYSRSPHCFEIWRISPLGLRLVFGAKKNYSRHFLFNPLWLSPYAVRVIIATPRLENDFKPPLDDIQEYLMAMPIKNKWRLF